jgi:tRNA dimethylallyltransferase
MPMILAIVGPTGVGKTRLSVELAKKYNAIIVNCDAVQVYKELNIGSAKPTESEKAGVPHILFDIKSVVDNYTVMDYQNDLRTVIKKNEGKNIIIVGGTGLYLMAGLFDYEFASEDYVEDYSELSNEELYKLALEKDSKMTIHKNNRIRLIRFLNRDTEKHNGNKLLYDVKFIGLTLERTTLYDRINKRVDEMVENGLVEEVKNLMPLLDKSRVLKSAIGYKEMIQYLNGEIALDEAIELIKKNSRHYAKRQYTWFNNKMNINWFNVNLQDFSHTIKEVEDFLHLK